MQIVKTGLCSVLLRVFDRWDRYEGRMRLKICAHILQTLQHLCNISMSTFYKIYLIYYLKKYNYKRIGMWMTLKLDKLLYLHV